MVVICHVNVRSLLAQGRLEELKFFVSVNTLDILCLTETWLKPKKNMQSTLTLPEYQPPFRYDCATGRGGGVAIYVRNESLPSAYLPLLRLTLNVLLYD